MSWFRKDTADEDKTLAEAAETVIEGAVDADTVNRIELRTGRNLRDQLSVAEAEEMRREADLRGFGWKRN